MPRPNSNEYHDIAGTGLTAILSSDGGTFLIDTERRDVAQRHCWRMHLHGYPSAVTRNKEGRLQTVYLHRLLCQTTTDKPHVDHANGAAWDCREANLRPCTRSENLRNQRLRVTNSTGIKGVSLMPAIGQYRARIKANGKDIHLGQFRTAEQAATVVRAARARLHAEFARHE